MKNQRGAVNAIYVVIITAVVVGLVVGGVVYFATPEEKTPAKKTIGVSMHTLAGDWYAGILQYVRWVAEDLGYDVIVVNCEYDPTLQRTQVKYMIDREIDGLIYCASDIEATKFIAELCNERGIPCITLDVDTNSNYVDLNVTVGVKRMAGLAMKEMVARIKEKYGELRGPIFEIMGGMEDTWSLLISAGVRSILDEYPEVEIHSIAVEWDPAVVRTRITSLIKKYGRPTAITVGGWGPLGLAAMEALDAEGMLHPVGHPEHVIMGVSDCDPGFNEKIREGYGDVAFNESEPYLSGLCVYYIDKILKEGKEAALPELGTLMPEDLTPDLGELTTKRFGLSYCKDIGWYPAEVVEQYGHKSFVLNGVLITIDGMVIGVTPEEVTVVTPDDPQLYTVQFDYMKEHGYVP